MTGCRKRPGTSIGVRRRPDPRGRPGFVRVDTVHQGDLNGEKGLYALNVVDQVTQFEHTGAVVRITEHFLPPVLEDLLSAFPFRVEGFHADNGSEYVNHHVARLLNKLHTGEFTKSRPRRSNDNALVESKNGAIVRKWLGRAHIPADHAPAVNDFLRDHLCPLINFHRPRLTFEELDRVATATSGLQAAKTVREARRNLFRSLDPAASVA